MKADLEFVDEAIERDIFDTPVNHKEAKEEQKRLLLPMGNYRTVAGALSVTGKTTEDGRRVASFFGDISQGGEVKGRIGFRFSPDVRYKENDQGEEKPDWNYKMYLQVLRAFKETTGEDVVTDTELVQFVRDYGVQLRIVQTDSGDNMVVQISKARD